MKQRQSNQQTSTTLYEINLPIGFLREVQKQKQQLLKIRQQQQTISSIDENIRRRNQQILQLKALVNQYQPYYKKYNQLTYEFTQKSSQLSQKQKQFQILLQQVNQLLKQNELIQQKLFNCEQERSKLLTEHHQIQKLNHEVEQTFKLYQEECKKKQVNLLKDLQKAYKQVTQLNNRIDSYEMKVFENQELKKKLSLANKSNEQAPNNVIKHNRNREELNNDSLHHTNLNQNKRFLSLKQQNENLKLILNNKEDQLTKYKILNQELSIEFDKSVNKICDFQRQLSKYRQENHQLQKMLNLFVQKEKYQKMHIRQLQKLKQNRTNERDQNQNNNSGKKNHSHHHKKIYSNQSDLHSNNQ